MKNEKSIKTNAFAELAIFVLVVAALASLPAAWLTHIFICLSNEAWGLLVAGAIMFPIGIIHGYGLWFGFF